ncbi:MAG TPA: OmpA family protein [Longimicrobiales bacterium]
MQKRVILPALVGALLVGACSGNEPPQQVGPTPEELAAQARADSIEAARRAEEERRRLEEERRRAEEEARRRAEEEARRAREILAEMVHFDYDKYDIRPMDQETLRRKVSVLRANPDVRVRIVGHADERGSDEYNLALGLRRANAVKDFLVGFGLDASRFETVSMGEEQPIDPASNEAAWAQNRRAEFQVTAGEVTKTGM